MPCSPHPWESLINEKGLYCFTNISCLCFCNYTIITVFQLKAESEQLLIEFADADKKRKEERKRQLDLINLKREQRRQQMMDPERRVHFGGGNKRQSDA